MVPTPPSFILYRPEFSYNWKTRRIKTNISVLANGFYDIATVHGQKGRLGQVSVNFDSQTALRLYVELDNQIIVNHTPADIETTGAGKLAIEIPNGLLSLLQTTKSAANNYSISFMGHLLPLDFDRRMVIKIFNDTTSAVDFQALYAIWGILGRCIY